jgi:putative aldouronate transport system substrate-binding protein
MKRRTLFKLAGAAAVGAPVLAACGGGVTATVSNVGANAAPWPTYIPITTAKPDLPGTAAGVQDAYLTYPAKLFQATKGTPGDGSVVSMLCDTYGTVTAFDDSNKLFAAVQSALGVKVNLRVVPDVGANYLTTFSTMTAGNDSPDLMAFEGGYTVPNQSLFIAAKCADLTDFLSGDAIKDYPNLANIPTYAWEGMGRIGGKIYGVPIHRPRIAYAMFGDGDKMGQLGGKGLSTQDFQEGLLRLTSPGHFALGDCVTLPFGYRVHAANAGAPNVWKLDSGAFQTTYGTDAFKQSLATMQSFWAKGLWDPDVLSMPATQMKTLFANGTTATVADGWGGYPGYVNSVRGSFPVKILRPYGSAPTPWFGTGNFGFTALRQASSERVKMLLRILDFLAAPFGSTEWELVNYGVECVHFTRGADGGPSVPTALGGKENRINVPFVYVASAPQVIYNPGAPDASREAYEAERDMVPIGVANPAVPYLAGSATYSTKWATLDTQINDAITGIVTGRQPLSSWDGSVKQFRAQGGDQIAHELAEQHAAR